jgi:hypothetical protein
MASYPHELRPAGGDTAILHLYLAPIGVSAIQAFLSEAYQMDSLQNRHIGFKIVRYCTMVTPLSVGLRGEELLEQVQRMTNRRDHGWEWTIFVTKNVGVTNKFVYVLVFKRSCKTYLSFGTLSDR